MRHNGFRLLTLGRLALVHGPSHEEVPGCQRRKLALLAYLGLADRPTVRGVLVEMFWGDEEEERGRHSLSNALWFLRHVLGADSITSRRADISLAAEAGVAVDATELLDAARKGDHARVIELYGGVFLEGVYIPGADTFEQWVSSERTRLELAFTKACAAECRTAAASREWDRCATVASRWLELIPTSAEAALHLLNALRASKTPEGRRAALAEYHRLVARLEREYASAPAPQVIELAHQIEQRANADAASVAALVPEVAESASSSSSAGFQPDANAMKNIAPPLADSPFPDARPLDGDPAVTGDLQPDTVPPRVRAHVLGARRKILAAAATLVLISGAAYAAYAASRARENRGATDTGSSIPAIAVTDIAGLGRDTASMWLEDGFAQMLASDLARETNAEIVSPARVRDTRTRAELPVSGALTPESALDIARRLGATIDVRGGFTHGAGTFVLDLILLDVKSGRTLRSFTVTGSDPLALATQAAERIVEGSDVDAARVRFAGVETSNVLAYQHFIRALQAEDAGRVSDERKELDATIALDSGFADAIVKRRAIAATDGESAVEARLGEALLHARLTSWDARTQAIDSLLHAGELARSEQLARAFVQRYPRDPRAYDLLGRILYNEGNWPAMQATFELQLALDSLAIGAGNGPCAPCGAYDALIGVRMQRGDLAGAEHAARQWVRLQPDLPRAWTVLSAALNYSGRYDAAIDAQRHAVILSGDDHFYADRLARILIAARRFDAADAMARSWTSVAAARPELGAAIRYDQLDLHVLIQRERGQLRESVRTVEGYIATHSADDVLRLEEIDALGRLGDYSGVNRVLRAYLQKAAQTHPVSGALPGDIARYFCWSRAIEANALAGSGDTVRLNALADSIRTTGMLSYYGRDRRLFHHVLGLVAFAGRRYREAEQDFAAARWGVAGWTETVAWQARAELAADEPARAVATLREGYEAPLDAMGRYEPRSELDYLMSVAFTKAGIADSAAVYRHYADRALAHADPEVQTYLHSLVPNT